ncbi:MAG: SDR family oxidoreductase [Planctomycetota bacterium]|nr:MAG: SDR family oxidoreductase [Planctomycetota bacterium]
MRGLAGKAVVVTGAARGIGRATAQRFAEEGARVVVADRDGEGARAVAEAIEAAGGKAWPATVDVADPDSVEALFASVRERFGGIDTVVNNAGILADATLAKLDLEAFDRVLAVNLRGTFLVGRAAAELLREQGRGGVILNAASVVALYGNFGQTNYVASKAGVVGMTRVWARELGKHRIRVNAVAPGFVRTAMTETIPPEVTEGLVARIPLRRMGEPEEVAALYAFLASDDAAYITGAVLSVDGGVVV